MSPRVSPTPSPSPDPVHLHNRLRGQPRRNSVFGTRPSTLKPTVVQKTQNYFLALRRFAVFFFAVFLALAFLRFAMCCPPSIVGWR